MDRMKISDTPFDSNASDQVLKFLLSHRIINKKGNLKDFVVRQMAGKDVLDIGACEHDLEHMNERSDWLHGKICAVAKSCKGVDILPKLVDKLNAEGYDFVLTDATSDTYLGKKFDVVNIGDVIEHVDDPVRLLKFAKRHLKKGGEIFVATPNPFFIKTIMLLFTQGTVVANLEHVSWVTPSLALEISRRAGVKLDRYYVSHPNSPLKKYLLWFLPMELKGAVFLYVFK
ncbi:MAG: class I SAM-dependent methyltransferase [archaeon]